MGYERNLASSDVLISEFRLAPQDWESIMPLIQRIINESPVKRLGKNEDGTARSPLQVMTGLRPSRNEFTFEMQKEVGVPHKVDAVRAMKITNIDKVQAALDIMHKYVSDRVSNNRGWQIMAHNRKTNIVSPNFY